jgi:hypothetical protein
MSWVKIDDKMGEHPKYEDVGLDGIGLQLVAIMYANRQQTDGKITRTALKRLTNVRSLQPVVNKLLKAGIWEDMGDHYQIHDYLHYQRSRAQIWEASDKQSKAGKRGAEKRWASEKGMGSAMGSPHDDPYSQKKKENKKKIVTTDVVTIADPPSAKATEIVPLRKEKPRDEIWDAVMWVCRINTSGIPAGARSGYGKVVKELKQLGATPQDIHERGAAYRIAYRDAPLTPHALIKHWAQVEGVATQPQIDKNELELQAWVRGEM